MIPRITLIIASNRKQKDYEKYLPELLKNKYLFHLVVVNKYPLFPSQSQPKKTHQPKLIEITFTQPGVSRARNLAINQFLSNTDIFAFTDDDCIMNDQWLKVIHTTFQKHPEISLLFGQTKAYQPERHPHQVCDLVFPDPEMLGSFPNQFHITTSPCHHGYHVGFGNNMAVKAEVFQKLGGFKEWLGPGSIGSNCEDGELINRSLFAGYKIGYEPTMLIHHNKWLTKKGKIKQDWSYNCGEMACYGWFAIRGHSFAQKVIVSDFRSSYHQLKQAIKATLTLNRSAIHAWVQWGRQVTAHAWGTIVALSHL